MMDLYPLYVLVYTIRTIKDSLRKCTKKIPRMDIFIPGKRLKIYFQPSTGRSLKTT